MLFGFLVKFSLINVKNRVVIEYFAGYSNQIQKYRFFSFPCICGLNCLEFWVGDFVCVCMSVGGGNGGGRSIGGCWCYRYVCACVYYH